MVLEQPPTPLTVRMIYPYYENPKMLERQVENWNRYAGELRGALRVILIDDGSTPLMLGPAHAKVEVASCPPETTCTVEVPPATDAPA